MNEAQFQQLADELFLAIEEAVDASGANLDYENNGGVLTIECEDSGTQVIVSRQVANHEIWVAAKSGGFHCAHQHGEFVCGTTGEPLAALLSRVCSEQSDTALVLEL